jgi:hypothetical protein
MRRLNVLVGCELSGKVRDAFTRLGHFAMSCDLEPSESPGPHFQGDVRDALRIRGWDLGIFHPPCTYLCVSGLHWNKRVPGRQEKTDEALRLVEDLLNADIPHIALENPIGCISTEIRRPDQIIQPYQFGHDASKKTCLWLKYLPPLVLDPELYVEPRTVCSSCKHVDTLPNHVKISLRDGCLKCGERVAPRWGNQTDSGQNRLGPSEDRAKLRSETYQGIADAMAMQWSQYILNPL